MRRSQDSIWPVPELRYVVGEDKRGACMTAQRAGRLVRGSEDTKEER